MSKTPRGSSNLTGAKQPNAWLLHQQETAAFIRERDANPVEIVTIFGTWRSLKGGCSQTTYLDPAPIKVSSKQKYRR